MIAGLGPHCRRIHYPLLGKCRIPLAIDVYTEEKTIHEYCNKTSNKPEEFIFLSNPNDPAKALARLQELHSLGQIDGIVISTEPSSRLPYLNWALDNNIPSFIDKPPFLPKPFVPNQIEPQFNALLERASKSKANCIVNVQRRYHPGYSFIWNYVAEFVGDFGVPITHFDIYHSDGVWPMAEEMNSKNTHPYKFGYGKLAHSGYHFLDLLAWFRQINALKVPNKHGKHLSHISACQFSGSDCAHIFSPSDLKRLLLDSPTKIKSPENDLGELNVHCLLQFAHENGSTVDTASLNLMQNSISRRAWFHPKVDQYKGNGRIRHERFSLSVGSLLNVQVHSYQSAEAGKRDFDECAISETSKRLLEAENIKVDTGKLYKRNQEHMFDVTIYRNTGVVGGLAFERFEIGDLLQKEHENVCYLGHNELGRFRILEKWLRQEENDINLLQSQRESMYLMSRLYLELQKSHEQRAFNFKYD